MVRMNKVLGFDKKMSKIKEQYNDKRSIEAISDLNSDTVDPPMDETPAEEEKPTENETSDNQSDEGSDPAPEDSGTGDDPETSEGDNTSELDGDSEPLSGDIGGDSPDGETEPDSSSGEGEISESDESGDSETEEPTAPTGINPHQTHNGKLLFYDKFNRLNEEIDELIDTVSSQPKSIIEDKKVVVTQLEDLLDIVKKDMELINKITSDQLLLRYSLAVKTFREICNNV